MKVALVTLQDNYNFGNRLQNYALQTVLENHGCEVYNLDNGYSDALLPDSIAIFKDKIKNILGKLGSKKYKKKHLEFQNSGIRRKALEDFTNTYIHNLTRVTYDGIDIGFDLGISGSDQVWHKWKGLEKELPYYYLSFLPLEKRASYAASFGFSSFPEEDYEQHMNGLNGMRYISCREQSGCHLVKQLTGKDAFHVLDPTLLLTPSEWRELSKAADTYAKELAKDKYSLIFFLGPITDDYRKEIEKKSEGRRQILFNNLYDSRVASFGPDEFLYLIDHADNVFTDSFHCTVFSVLFDKTFEVFRRQQDGFRDMFGRIEELLEMNGMEDCAYGGTSECVKAENFGKMKKRSIEYIDMILNK